MYFRSPKESAIDVIVYERDLLGYCARTVDQKKQAAVESPTDDNLAEYYLTIEGFLLHFRNLLGFFINKRLADTDLTINKPEQWANGRSVDAHLRASLTERAWKVNRAYGLSNEVNCYRKISWFLQHCTGYRYQVDRAWDIRGMFNELSPIIEGFIRHVAPQYVLNKQIAVLKDSDYCTASLGPPYKLPEFTVSQSPIPCKLKLKLPSKQ